MDDPQEPDTVCTCPPVKVGSERYSSWNWNPDCPRHGTDSDWWGSEEQRAERRAASERLRELQALARQRRGERRNR